MLCVADIEWEETRQVPAAEITGLTYKGCISIDGGKVEMKGSTDPWVAVWCKTPIKHMPCTWELNIRKPPWHLSYGFGFGFRDPTKSPHFIRSSCFSDMKQSESNPLSFFIERVDVQSIQVCYDDAKQELSLTIGTRPPQVVRITKIDAKKLRPVLFLGFNNQSFSASVHTL